MLENFHLAAIAKHGTDFRLLHVPLHQSLQDTLSEAWEGQYSVFVNELQETSFNAGYQPEDHECLFLLNFELPGWLAEEDSQTAPHLDSVSRHEDALVDTAGIVALAQNVGGEELLLFQNFTRSRVIQPGQFLLLRHDTYESTDRPGLTLDHKLSAVYRTSDSKLLFRSYRTVNTFLPLSDFYKEASEEEIRDVLAHPQIAPEDADSLAAESNQWFRKRFAMLRDSRILDRFTAEDIRARSNGYEITVRVERDRVIFPADRNEAKKLLQFLNEELFRGPITEELYETNSKKRAGT